jgi:flavoprotein
MVASATSLSIPAVLLTAPVSTCDFGTLPSWIFPADWASASVSPGSICLTALRTCIGCWFASARLSAPRT